MDHHTYIAVAAVVVGALTWGLKQPWSGAIFKKIPKGWRWLVPAVLGAGAATVDQLQGGVELWRALEVGFGAVVIPIAGHEIVVEGLISEVKRLRAKG